MIYRRGSVWWFCFVFAGGRIRESTRTANKALARQIERKRHQQLEEYTHGIRKRVAPKQFSVASSEWLEAKEPTWTSKTYEYNRQNLVHLKPDFGGLLTIDIRAVEISNYQKRRLKAGASPKTVNHEIGTLRSVLKRLRLWENLAYDVTMLRIDVEVGKSLSQQEEQRLLAACHRSRSRSLLPIVELALHTGLRKGEILQLRWHQIDFLNQELTVGKAKTRAGTGRHVPLNRQALVTLQTWVSNFPDRQPSDAVFPSEAIGLAGNLRKSHHEILNPAVPLGDVKSAWASAKRRSGIKARFHDLRHTACTRLLERGASLSVVASVMGWSASTTATMAAKYSHIGHDARRTALDTLVEPTESSRLDDALSLANRS